MNENTTVNNTAAPAVAAEVAPKATPVIIARKSLMGEWKKTGAPPKEIIGLTKNPTRGSFTKHDIFERNGRTISLLTIDKRIKQLVKAHKLCRMAEALKTEGPGRPSYRYNFDLTKAVAKKPRTRKAKAQVAVEVAAVQAIDLNDMPANIPVPVAEPAMPAPAPAVETPAPAVVETPAEVTPIPQA